MPYQWRIPVYQRHYAWNAEEEYGPTNLFWDVVKDQAKKRLDAQDPDDKKPAPHYFGAVLVESKPESLSSFMPHDVVDGQQRLTTLNVALFSLIGLAGKKGYKDQFKNELAKYIFTDDQKRDHPKLLPTNFDQNQYQNLLYWAYSESEPGKRDKSEYYDKSMVVRACHFFNNCFEKFVENNDKGDSEIPLKALQNALLDGFQLVVIPLEKTDEAQKIFEAINNTARPLTTFDLIRNDIFYRADKEAPSLDVELFRSKTWQQFETPFWEDNFNKKGEKEPKHIETYIERMLVAKQKTFLLLNRNSIYREYKAFAEKLYNKGIFVKYEIEEISAYVDIYKHLVGANQDDRKLNKVDFGYFKSHHVNTVVFLPIIFIIATCDAPLEDKQRMIKLLESWYIRRSVCNLKGDYNKQAPKLCEKLGSAPSYAKLDNFLKESEDETRVFPKKDTVESILFGLDFYSRKGIVKYVFESIVSHTTSDTRNERRDIKGLTIDHIFPQGWKDNKYWRKALNGHDEGTINTKIHTIGNLTPMSKGTNSGKSNLPWDPITDKSGARWWLKQSDLKMTRDLAEKDSWDIKDIDERTRELVKIICDVWPYDIDN